MTTKLIANELIVVESSDPQNIFCYTPAICRGKDKRLIASYDIGGKGVAKVSGPLSKTGDFERTNQLRVIISDNEGNSWHETCRLAMYHAMLFSAGEKLYLLGCDDELVISCSCDNGETWCKPVVLNDDYQWKQSGCRVCCLEGTIYISFEIGLGGKTWPDAAPVLLAAKDGDDLTDPNAWRYSKPFDPRPVIEQNQVLGIPFFMPGDTVQGKQDPRYMGEPGILESNVIAVYNHHHTFYDPQRRSVLIFMRAHTGMGNLAVVLKGIDHSDGTLEISCLNAPSGLPMFYIPMPGGQMKFDMQYDDVSKLYWMISTQCTDVMTAPQFLPDDRYNLPDNERRRLVLHFSKDAFSWCFAGIIAQGDTEKQARHYANMQIDGNDILIFARSGDVRALSAHNGNILTLHRIANFRNLIY